MSTEDRNTFGYQTQTGSENLYPDSPKSRTSFNEIAEPLKETARGITQAVKTESRSLFSDGQEKVANQLESMAQALRETGGKLREQDMHSVAELAETGAEQVERVSGYVREKSLEDMARGVGNFARQRPGLFIGGALAAGFLLGQLLGNPARSRTDEERTTDS